jgi:membrane protease YdiL (CAAX protease family)
VTNPTHPYGGKDESAIALLSTCLWFIAIVLRLSAFPDWTFAEILFEAGSFAIFAAIPIFFLATPNGEQFAHRVLLPNHGLTVQSILCLALAIYIGIGHSLGINPKHFPWLEQLEQLFISGQFWLNTLLFLSGVFIAARIPFVVLDTRQTPFLLKEHRELCLLLVLNLLYLTLHNTGNPLEGFWIGIVYGLVCLGMNWPGWKKPQGHNHLIPFDLFLMILCTGIIYVASTPSLSFGVFIAVDLFILVLIYGIGLGRAHFGYSFQIRPRDWRVLGGMIEIATLVLIPLALISGFVKPEHAIQLSWGNVLSYFALFTLRVGIFEEIFFRSGLMVFIRDQLQQNSTLSSRKITILSAIGCSILFGLAHIGNEASANTALAPWQYKGLYILLATTASLFYSATFAQTNRLAPSILIHGFVDTTAVLLLGGFLAIPF